MRSVFCNLDKLLTSSRTNTQAYTLAITMEQWEQVIVEWINCLEILKEPLKSTEELEDGVFYSNFLNLIWTKHDHDCNQENIITKFIEDEYPSFKINIDDNAENIYIASLLMLHTSQETIFHTPMCNKLKHETQIQIKTFLENILPLGRDITRETMKEIVTELQEDTLRTPNSRQTTPLKDFTNSPAFRSARSSYKIMTERTRELRELRCNLDVERFKNAELRDDLTIQQNKIQNLKKNLEEKTMQIKSLREERMKPCTPQSSRKKKNTSLCEDYYKKHINDLEIQLNKQQDTIDDLESEKDVLSKMLASVQRQCAQYKESSVNSEQSLESLSNKIETKDRELVELRIHNEELRVYIKELNKNSAIEQSFEVEESIALPHPVQVSLNASETLSSVIEIQLQEAKEESAILYAQVDTLKDKLGVLTKDYRNVMELNRDLQKKIKILDKVQAELNDMEKKLHVSNTDITNLQTEKTSLVAQNKDLKSSLASKEKELSETEQANTMLSMKFDNLKVDVENLNELLGNEKANSSNLSAMFAQVRLQISEHLTNIHNLTEERDSYRSSIENCGKSLINMLHCDNQFIQVEINNFNNVTLNDIVSYFNTMLHNCNTICTSYKHDIEKLKITINETNANLLNQELTIATLKAQNEQNIIELANIEEERKQKNLLLDEQKEIIHKYSQEIEILKEVKDEKSVLEENVHKMKKDLISQQSLLKSAMTHLRNIQDVMKDYRLMKQGIQQILMEYQENAKTIFGQMHHDYQTLYHKFHKTKEEKEELQCNYNQTKEELSNAQTVNATLQQDLLQYKDAISCLEEKEGSLSNDLNKCKQNIQELEEIKQTLEEQCATIKIEANDNLEILKSENVKISLELENVTNMLNLLQKEMSDIRIQMQLKTARIDELLSDISTLQAGKDHLIRSHEEAFAAKNKEVELKEETVLALQSENVKISLELENVTGTLNLLQKEMSDIRMQMQLKTARIDELLLDISTLQTGKDHLIRSHEEAFAAKNKEVGLKEETVSALQAKMEKLMNEASSSDKKLKEIIINLQEVRSSQDAVLATQEIALKEKCLHIEQLQKEFERSKKTREALREQLEDEKSLYRELEIKFSALEDQVNDRNRAVQELQEELKVISAELETNKDHCKFMDASQAEIMKLCQELQNPTKNLNSTIMETCSNFDILNQSLHDMTQYECTRIDDKTETILNIIKMALDELHISQKAILHLALVNTELNKTLAEQKILIVDNIKDKEEACSLKNRVQELEIIAQKRNEYLNSLIKSKESLRDSLEEVFASRNDLDTVIKSSKQKWNDVLADFQDILHTDSSVCNEYKQLQAKKADLENTLSKYHMNHLENIKSMYDILWEKFLWTEKKLHDTYLCSIHEKECLDVLTNAEEDQFSTEKMIIDVELKKNKILQTDVTKTEEQIKFFVASVTSYENSLKSGEIKTQAETEKNLQNQINQLTKEKRDLKTKADNIRLRNVKLERNMDDLRIEIKKLKSETTPTTNVEEVQSLKNQLEHLKEQNQQLREDKDESSKIAKQGFESQLKEVHTTYELKLEDMKQKMKKAYNEQIAKVNSDQEKIIREKLHSQMESMCQKQREEINRYKSHVGDLSSQLWSVGEKLLIEQQQKQDALKHLRELQTKFKETGIAQQMSTVSHKTSRLERQETLPENAQQTMHKVTVVTEERFERRHSVRNIQAMGNAFKAEDEEEIFDNVYLADMKSGNALPTTDVDRLSVLQMRNAQCKPHLKSSYPAEMQFLPSILTEEEIKTGCVSEDIFNDSLSQSLLPEQKAKKKDRSQTSYKKPGPPTPSKNGGRLSLQGNELRSPSSRILRERNVDRRTTTTPALKNLFMLRRQDENASNTPKGRRLSSIFRKPRTQA